MFKKVKSKKSSWKNNKKLLAFVKKNVFKSPPEESVGNASQAKQKILENPISIRFSKWVLIIIFTLILLFIPIWLLFHNDIEFAIEEDKSGPTIAQKKYIWPVKTDLNPANLPNDDPHNNTMLRIQLSIGINIVKSGDYTITFPHIEPKNAPISRYQASSQTSINLSAQTSYIGVNMLDSTKSIDFNIRINHDYPYTNYHVLISNFIDLNKKNNDDLVGFTITYRTQKLLLYAATSDNTMLYMFNAQSHII